MDYAFLGSLAHYIPRHVLVSYDIACQWSRSLWKRCSTIYPPNPVSINQPIIRFFVPKFHIAAHIPECQIKYSLNLSPGSGRTDGESPERGWAGSNDMAYSTRVMGPGRRRDTLDDFFGDWNWAKTVQLGTSLIEIIFSFAHPVSSAFVLRVKAQKALVQRQEMREAFDEFHGSLPVSMTRPWTAMVEAWEADSSKPNPFEQARTGELNGHSVLFSLDSQAL